ncbi:multidrug ABC transporter ATP-binding protein [Anaerobacillus arseniciselenatis]|uniref:Multidrug ABC transporter ATP-binding protein n=1 Tax=Anaerobacillus arseniciselenatis TaxID=85682 RepID=A0A1S2LTH5_9BACI|nr:ABC transporter ATP-binding protein [Anaerobacillus arseniciselenatis]OIJ15634.1 multidrug ABC transporter ATP-binding protein [Anaerobacillus arseniciselenatis]
MAKHPHSASGGPPPKTKNIWGTVKRIWLYLAEQKGLLTFILFLITISVILTLLGPYLIGVAVDDYIVLRNTEGLLWLLIFLGIIYVVNSLAIWLQNYLMIGIAQNTVYSLRRHLFRHLHRLPISFFDRKQHGELMSRLTNDIENVSRTLNTSVIQIFSSVLTLVGTVAFMIYLSPLLTLITLTVIPLLYFGMKWITTRTRKFFREQQRNLGDLNGYIEETVSGQSVVKTFSQEEKVIKEFNEKNERLKTSGYWAQAYSGFIPKLMNVLNNLSFAIIALAGGVLALYDLVSIGIIVTFTQYSRQFTRPLNDLANQYNTLLSAVAGAERVFDVLDEEKEKEAKDHMELPTVKGNVDFRNVSFSYDENEDGQTIFDVSFRANAGETVALVGPTGAGKTTIINLLSRFYDCDKGSILIDGNDISSVTRESLRQHMGFVLQDPFLFQGTIRENIRYGKLDASDEEVIEAAKLANAYSFIKKFPNGFDTVLTQEGGGISQGQKQLLSISRAILARPKILILDEATSSIDTVTEIKIQEALSRLMSGRTSFVIAHRLNTIQQADQIIVLNDGQVLEKGDHQSLLKQKGFYYELYNGHLKNDVV